MNLILKNKIQESLANFHFFSGIRLEEIPFEERIKLETCSKIIHVPKKTILYSEWESPKGVYIIHKGKIKVSKINSDASFHNFFIFSTGELFGHNSAISGEKNMVTATVIETCELRFIEKDDFSSILDNSPALKNLFLQSLSHELNVFVNQINVFSKKKIKERLALFLLLLNEKFKLPGQVPDEAEILLSRIDLANFTGTSIENLVRMLRQFKDKNYIRTTNKSIFINDFEALYNLSSVSEV
jgi:CRP/FNR family transcriptional regulator, polysaccharide utilization system transcription regulator